MFTVNKNPSAADLRKFGWAMLIGFGVLAVLLWLGPWVGAWRRDEPMPSLTWTGSSLQWVALSLVVLGLVMCLVSHVSVAVGKALYVLWMTFTLPIGMVMTTVLLTVLFILLLPPFSIIVRLSDPLRRKLKKDGTYWEDYKPHEPTLERMRRPF